jgi:hypothetical protein
MFSDEAPRGLFSILLAGSQTPTGQQARTRADGARTHMSAFEDRDSHVLMRASHLEDMYVTDHATEPAPISSWDRTVMYLRPGLFVVHDRTAVTSASANPRIRWQVALAPARADGNVLDGGAVGALLQSDGGDYAVLFGGGVAGATIAGRLRYRLPAAPTVNVVADLEPDATYTVTTTADPGGVLVELVPGPGRQASPAGVLSFTSP